MIPEFSISYPDIEPSKIIIIVNVSGGKTYKSKRLCKTASREIRGHGPPWTPGAFRGAAGPPREGRLGEGPDPDPEGEVFLGS